MKCGWSRYLSLTTWCEKWQTFCYSEKSPTENIFTSKLSPVPQLALQHRALSEEVPHLSIAVCKTQKAFLSRLLLKFFFSPLKFPLPALGEAVSNSRWGPEAGCTVGSWVCPSSRPRAPSLLPLLPSWPLPRTHPDRSELGGPVRQRHKPDMMHITHTVCLW